MITGKNGNMTTKKTQASHVPPVISGDSKPAISSVFNQGGFFHAFVPILFNVIETIMCVWHRIGSSSKPVACVAADSVVGLKLPPFTSNGPRTSKLSSGLASIASLCEDSNFKDAKKMQNIDFLHEW